MCFDYLHKFVLNISHSKKNGTIFGKKILSDIKYMF